MLRKDLPWIVGWSIVGCIALAGSLAEQEFLRVFVLPKGEHEAMFHTAWIAGLLLGATAACFDEVLGVREYLRQRPVGPRQMMRARVVGVGLVLATWFVAAPVLYALAMLVFGEVMGPLHAGAIPAIWASLVVAVSACAIGLCAGSLPAPWWLRLTAAASGLLGSFAFVKGIAHTSEFDDASVFVLGHLVVGVVFTGAAFVASEHLPDADRPWPRRSRRWLAGLVTVVIAVFGSTVLGLTEGNALNGLHRAYPSLVVQGGQVRLADSSQLRERRLRLVDANHVATGEAQELSADVSVIGPWASGWSGWSGFYRFDAPRWHDRPVSESVQSPMSILYLTHDGEAWMRNLALRTLQRVERDGAQQNFEPGSYLWRIGNSAPYEIHVFEPTRGMLHGFDTAHARFVPLPLPNGDRFDEFGTLPGEDRTADPLQTKRTTVYCGERGSYVLRDGVFVASPATEKTTKSITRGPSIGMSGDNITFTLVLSADGDPTAFSHLFTPRQPVEVAWAGVAMAFAACRPPLLLLGGHLSYGETGLYRYEVLDALVARGSRSWLIGGAFVLGMLCAGVATRRLRRLGAPRATWQYWAVLNVLLGPAALLASIAFERPRAYGSLPPLGAIEPPRILTPTILTEVPA